MNTKSKEQIFTQKQIARLVKEFHYESKTSFYVTIIARAPVLHGLEEATDFDDMLEMCEEFHEYFKNTCDSTPNGIIDLAEYIHDGLVALYGSSDLLYL